MNTKTEKPKFFWRKNRKIELKNCQNRKTENLNAPSLKGYCVYKINKILHGGF